MLARAVKLYLNQGKGLHRVAVEDVALMHQHAPKRAADEAVAALNADKHIVAHGIEGEHAPLLLRRRKGENLH